MLLTIDWHSTLHALPWFIPKHQCTRMHALNPPPPQHTHSHTHTHTHTLSHTHTWWWLMVILIIHNYTRIKPYACNSFFTNQSLVMDIQTKRQTQWGRVVGWYKGEERNTQDKTDRQTGQRWRLRERERKRDRESRNTQNTTSIFRSKFSQHEWKWFRYAHLNETSFSTGLITLD